MIRKTEKEVFRMKKILAILLIVSSIFMITACNEAEAPETGKTEQSTTETPLPTVTPIAPIETPPITREVTLIGENGEVFTPYEEFICCTDMQFYSNGESSTLNGDGYLMFYSIPNYLPQITEKIPEVKLSSASEIVISARAGVAFDEVTALDVYGEDHTLLAEGLTISEIVSKGQNEWKEKTLYLYFDASFWDMEASYEKNYQYGYFFKVSFAEVHWSENVPTPHIGGVKAHTELVYEQMYQEYSDGTGAMRIGDGALMFYTVPNYLPQIAEKIPSIEWDGTFAIDIPEKDDYTVRGGDTVSIYAEDYTELAKRISLDEFLTRAQSEWQGRMVYIEFSALYSHTINEELTESISECYFVKTTLN